MNAHVVAQLRALASAADVEVCGALVGHGSTIVEAWPLPNRSACRSTSFLIPAVDVLRAERQAEARGLTVVGFYHSHPRGAAAPSQLDTSQAVPGYLYVIVTNDGELRAWRLRADRSGFDEVRA